MSAPNSVIESRISRVQKCPNKKSGSGIPPLNEISSDASLFNDQLAWSNTPTRMSGNQENASSSFIQPSKLACRHLTGADQRVVGHFDRQIHRARSWSYPPRTTMRHDQDGYRFEQAKQRNSVLIRLQLFRKLKPVNQTKISCSN